MKSLLTTLFIIIGLTARAAPVDTVAKGLKTGKIIYDQKDGKPSPPQPIASGQIAIDATVTSVKKFVLQYDLTAGNTITANTTAGVVNADKTILFDIGTDLLKTTVKLIEKNGAGKEVEQFAVKFVSGQAPVASTPDKGTPLTQVDYQSYFKKNYHDLAFTDVGYKKNDDYYKIHIFLDQFGNALFSSIPTGIQRKYHYVLHIIGDPIDGQSRYILNQTTGTLNDNMSNYGSATAIPNTSNLHGAPIDDTKPVVPNAPHETIFEFAPTTDDMTFTVSTLTLDGKTNTLLKTYTIKKTSFYIGSFDIGVFKTWLSNPTFTSVNSPVEAGKQALKSTNTTPYVTASLMYTIYFSLYSALVPTGTDGKKYSYWGRSFLDDEGCFLRKIYPSVGVGLGSNTFSNFFLGLNYQPIQGFGIFAGRNIRSVNTFEAPSTVDLSNITTDQFNYYQNTKTKSEWAVGVLLDLSVFTKIIGSVSATK